MSTGAAVAFLLFVVGAGLFLVELWFNPWSPETFWKIIVTDGVLFAVTIVAAFLFRERQESEQLGKRDFD